MINNIIEVLSVTNKPMTCSEITKTLGGDISKQAIHKRLVRMDKKGLIRMLPELAHQSNGRPATLWSVKHGNS